MPPDQTAPLHPTLSVVIPFYNEGPNIRPLLDEVRAVVDRLGIATEVLAVDDGSTDDTRGILIAAAQAWTAVRPVLLNRNGGQAMALWQGFATARGAWIATFDGDGQNPPDELAGFWREREAADMIVGIRQNRQDSWARRAMSRIANAVRRPLLRDGVTDSGCALRLFRAEVRRSFLPLRTLNSFIPACAVSGGWRVIERPIAHRPRLAGTANYTFRSMAVLPFLDTLALCWAVRRMIRQAGPSVAQKH